MLTWNPSRRYLVERIQVATNVTTLQDNIRLFLSCSTLMSKALTRLSSTLRKKATKSRQSPSGKKKTLVKKEKEGMDSLFNSEGIEDVVHQSYQLSFESQPLNATVLTNNEYKTGMALIIFPFHFIITVNPPLVLHLSSFPKRKLAVGMTVLALPELSHAEDALIEWWKENKSTSIDYECIAEGRSYSIQSSDLHHRLKITCTPFCSSSSSSPSSSSDLRLEEEDLMSSNDTIIVEGSKKNECRGRTTVFYLSGSVNYSHNCIIRQIRSDFISKSSSSSSSTPSSILRVVSYNILSDVYASTDYSKKVIYSYLHDESYLDIEYRAGLTYQELSSYNADIICLQECDARVFDVYYMPQFNALNYSSFYSNKAGGTSEGCALFVNKRHLIPLTALTIRLKDLLFSDPLLTTLFSKLKEVKQLLTEQLSTIVQLSICQSAFDDNKLILILNTHLYYHPAAAYVRLLQTHVILSLAEKIKVAILRDESRSIDWKEVFTEKSIEWEGKQREKLIIRCSGTPTVSILFAGDLNSTPETAVIQYLNG